MSREKITVQVALDALRFVSPKRRRLWSLSLHKTFSDQWTLAFQNRIRNDQQRLAWCQVPFSLSVAQCSSIYLPLTLMNSYCLGNPTHFYCSYNNVFLCCSAFDINSARVFFIVSLAFRPGLSLPVCMYQYDVFSVLL